MSRMIKDCVSVHEPDTTRVSLPRDWIAKMAKFGVPKMLWGQYRQRYSLGKLSTTRHRKLVDDDKARQYIADNRFEYVEGLRRNIYVESNHLVYGLLDLVSEMFPNSKIVWVMRDPRSWVRSAINSTAYHLYGPFDWDSINLAVRAYNFPGDPAGGKWGTLTKFEKYCWYYNNVNMRAFELMKKVPEYKIYRYEDLFSNKDRDQYVVDLLEYSCSFNDGFTREYNYQPELLDVKIHAAASKRQLPSWPKWSSNQVEIIDRHCGDLMKQFGYGGEDHWQAKVDKVKKNNRIIRPAAV